MNKQARLVSTHRYDPVPKDAFITDVFVVGLSDEGSHTA